MRLQHLPCPLLRDRNRAPACIELRGDRLGRELHDTVRAERSPADEHLKREVQSLLSMLESDALELQRLSVHDDLTARDAARERAFAAQIHREALERRIGHELVARIEGGDREREFPRQRVRLLQRDFQRGAQRRRQHDV